MLAFASFEELYFLLLQPFHQCISERYLLLITKLLSTETESGNISDTEGKSITVKSIAVDYEGFIELSSSLTV